MSILRNVNVTFLCRLFSPASPVDLRNPHVPYHFISQSNIIVTKPHVALSILRNVHVALTILGVKEPTNGHRVPFLSKCPTRIFYAVTHKPKPGLPHPSPPHPATQTNPGSGHLLLLLLLLLLLSLGADTGLPQRRWGSDPTT